MQITTYINLTKTLKKTFGLRVIPLSIVPSESSTYRALCSQLSVFITPPLNVTLFISQVTLEAFAATELYEIWSGRQPRQDAKFSQLFGNSVQSWTPSISFGATKPPGSPEYGEGVSSRNVGKNFTSWCGCWSEEISLKEVTLVS